MNFEKILIISLFFCNFATNIPFSFNTILKTMHEQSLNLEKILHDTLESLQPVAILRGIHLVCETSEKPYFTQLPLDEVLPPVYCFIVKMMYIMPKGHTITLRLSAQYDEEKGTPVLRIEIITPLFYMNPNLIAKPEKSRFHWSKKPDGTPYIYVEWADETVNQSVEPLQTELGTSKREPQMDGLNSPMITSQHITAVNVNRFEAFAQDPWIQEKLKAANNRKDADFLENVLKNIMDNLGNENYDTDQLGVALGYSRTQLFRKIKQLTDFSTANYIRHVRLQRAAELLESSDMNVSEIADRVGFRELSYFSNCFAETFHQTPSEYRKTKR